jgi:tetratricopeptide (TPR) repeat protein
MVSGDVINTCARLQAAAAPGTVLVGEPTHRATERVFEYRPADDVVAKGKAEPVRAWVALAPRSRFGVDLGGRGRAPLVGRDREAALLSSALERVLAEREPQLVTLVGVPGIGKSRLVQELLLVVDGLEELVTWRQGRSLPYGEGVAFWALGEMVKAQAGILETATSDEAAALLSEATAAVIEDSAERAWVERHLRPLVGLVDDRGVDRAETAGEAAAAWRRFFEALAEHRPTVLVFEDLHWADDGLLDFVDELADRVAGVPLLVVASARPELLERRPAWGGGKRNSQTVSLTPLTDPDTARLILTLLDRTVIPADVHATLVGNAGGIPLFAEEFARMVGVDGTGEEVPETLQGVVAARIDGLPAEEKRVLHAASVLGKVFWTDALTSLVAEEPWLLDEQLHALERKDFVRRERRSSVAGARQYAFVHALVRDTAYGQLPRPERSRLHRAAAAWIAALPPERSEDRAQMLAHHLVDAIEYGEAAGRAVDDLRPAAAQALREAGDRAWALASLPAAARFYRRALEVAGTDPDPFVLFLLGRTLVHLENAGVDELERAVDGLLASGDRLTAAEAMVSLHEARWLRGFTGFELLERARDLVADAGDSRVRAYVLGSLGRFYGLAGRAADAIRHDEEAMQMAERIGDVHLQGWAQGNRGIARWGNGDIGGIEDVERALAIAIEIGSTEAARCRMNLGSTLDDIGDLDLAGRHLRDGLVSAERMGSSRWITFFRCELAYNMYVLGQWDSALSEARPLLAELRNAYHESEVATVVFGITAERGEPVDLDEVARIAARAREIRDPQVILPWLAIAARMHSALGRRESAADYLDELILVGSHEAAAFMRGSWFYDAAQAALALGREEELAALCCTGGMTRWSEAALALLSGEPLRAAELLREMGAFDEAGARIAAAEALAAEGKHDESVVQAERAMALYRELSAPPGIARAEAVLKAAA